MLHKSVAAGLYYLFVLILFSCNLSGQEMTTDVMELSTMANKLSKDSLEKYLTVIASDDMEGREVGHPGNVRAAQYLAGKLASFGYYSPPKTKDYLQYFPLYKQSWKNTGLEISQFNFEFLEDFYALPSQNPNLPSFQASEIVYLGKAQPGEPGRVFENTDLKNKVILIEEGAVGGQTDFSENTQDAVFNRKLEAARKARARVVFVISDNYDNRLNRYKSILQSPSVSMKLEHVEWTNVVYISPRAVARIMKGYENEIEKFKKILEQGSQDEVSPVVIRKPVQLNLHKVTESEYVPNVVGYLPGKDPLLRNELLVISAHFDHLGIHDGKIWNGADDDGSGVSAVLEISRVIAGEAARSEEYPRRSLLILLVNGEEKGLLGSSYYTENPLYPLRSTIANLNIDMIGRRDGYHTDNPYYVYAIGSDMLSTDLHNINEAVNRELTNLELDYRYNKKSDPNRFYYRSDHYNFAKNGIPVIFYFTGVHEDYHQPTDTIEKIEFSKMLTITKLVFGTAWELLNSDRRPVVDKDG